MKKILLFLGITTFLASCGKQPQIIKNVNVQSEVIEEELILKVQTQVDMGNISFPYLTLPIIHPKLNLEIGQITVAPITGSLNLLEIDLNFTSLLNLNLKQAQLPNGGMVPLMNQEEVITVKIDNKVYLYINPRQESFSIGVALPFKSLDAMGANVGNTSLFPVFAMEKAWGAAGIFTGKESGQNGFGFFANISAYVKDLNWQIPKVQKNTLAIQKKSLNPSAEQKEYIDGKIYQMHKRKLTLRYE